MQLGFGDVLELDAGDSLLLMATDRWLGKASCGCVVAASLPHGEAPGRRECPVHGRYVRLERVRGVVVPGIRCNSACQFAHRAECECSCGGANHGAGWGAGVITIMDLEV